MPVVGDRQRAAVVVGVVFGFLLLVAHLPASRPAAAQSAILLPTTTSAAVDSSSTTTRQVSTTVAPTPTSFRSRSTTTIRRAPASPTTTARRVVPSTTKARTGTSLDMDDVPATTDPDLSTTNTSEVPKTTTTTKPDFPLEQAASSSGFSTGSLVALVVAGLLTVALALSLLTVRYVRTTRPEGRHFD
ncbi:hypothetical protein BH24ACT1_BH24ACT1_12590 [soil metagenome]